MYKKGSLTLSARLIPDFESADYVYNKHKEEIDSSVERLKEIYNDEYRVVILISKNGYMTMISPYFYGEKFIIGYKNNGKAVYSDKLSASRLKLINDNYLLYKIV